MLVLGVSDGSLGQLDMKHMAWAASRPSAISRKLKWSECVARLARLADLSLISRQGSTGPQLYFNSNIERRISVPINKYHDGTLERPWYETIDVVVVPLHGVFVSHEDDLNVLPGNISSCAVIMLSVACDLVLK